MVLGMSLLRSLKRKKDESEEMAKRRKAKGKSVRNGNAPSPYNKYKKLPFFYGEGYKDNQLINGVLCRNGKPHRHKDKPTSNEDLMQAAE